MGWNFNRAGEISAVGCGAFACLKRVVAAVGPQAGRNPEPLPDTVSNWTSAYQGVNW